MGTIMARKTKRAPLLRSSPRKRGGDPGSRRRVAVGASCEKAARSPHLARGHEREDEGYASALYRLMAWLSPAFPVGAFSYSSGIEWAVEAATSAMPTRCKPGSPSCWPRAAAFSTQCSSPTRIARCRRRRSPSRGGRTCRRLRAVEGTPSGNHGARQCLRAGDACGLANAGARPAQNSLGRPGRLSSCGGGRRQRPRHCAGACALSLSASARRQLGVGRRAADPARPDRRPARARRAGAGGRRHAHSAHWSPSSTTSAHRRSVPTLPARGTRRSTRGCSGLEKILPHLLT